MCMPYDFVWVARIIALWGVGVEKRRGGRVGFGNSVVLCEMNGWSEFYALSQDAN